MKCQYLKILALLLGSLITNQVAFSQDSQDKTLRILMLGQSKGGKSTFINNFYNVLSGNFNNYIDEHEHEHEQLYRLKKMNEDESQQYKKMEEAQEEVLETAPLHIADGIVIRTALAEQMMVNKERNDPVQYKDIIEFSKDNSAAGDVRDRYRYILPAYLAKKKIEVLVQKAENVEIKHYAGVQDNDINDDPNTSQTRSISGYKFEVKGTALASDNETDRHFVELIDTPGLTDINNNDGMGMGEEEILNLIDGFLESDKGTIHAIMFVIPNSTSGQINENIKARYERYVSQFGYHPNDTKIDDYRKKFGPKFFFVASLKEEKSWPCPIAKWKQKNHRENRFINWSQDMIETIHQNYLIDSEEESPNNVFSQFLHTNMFGYKVPFIASFFPNKDKGGNVNDNGLDKDDFISMIGEFEMMALKLSKLFKREENERPWPFGEHYQDYRVSSRELASTISQHLEVKQNFLRTRNQLKKIEQEMAQRKEGLESALIRSRSQDTRKTLVYDNYGDESIDIDRHVDETLDCSGEIHVLNAELERESFALETKGIMNSRFKIRIEPIWFDDDLVKENDESEVKPSSTAPLERWSVQLGEQQLGEQDEGNTEIKFIVNLLQDDQNPRHEEETKEPTNVELVLGAGEKIVSEFADLPEFERQSIEIKVPTTVELEQETVVPISNLSWGKTYRERKNEFDQREESYNTLSEEMKGKAKRYRDLIKKGRKNGFQVRNAADNAKHWGNLDVMNNRLIQRSTPADLSKEKDILKRAKRRVLDFTYQENDDSYESDGEIEILSLGAKNHEQE